MSLRRRLVISLCVTFLICFFMTAHWVRGELRNSYSQVVEDLLVDYAHVVSAYLENNQLSNGSLKSLDDLFKQYKSHPIEAKIFDFLKDKPSLDVYVTNAQGVVLFSTHPEHIGHNFSRWNDVKRTLAGRYGARSTRTNPEDTRTSVYYVAAPIILNSKIVGVATISKTEDSILAFLDKALDKMFLGSLFFVVILGSIGALLVTWITVPLSKLQQYALDVSAGKRTTLPKSGTKEIKSLGNAFERMRTTLEGKKTVERYTQTLAHELKSPLTAIKGAAELCLEPMDNLQRQRFLKNIIDEANRSHDLLEKLLKIAALEATQKLEQTSNFSVVELLNEVKEALVGLWTPKKLTINVSASSHLTIQCDRFLVFQALRNVLQNAIEFSNAGDSISVESFEKNKSIHIDIIDNGPGIPAYAKDRIFEKFYSLERPDTKRKSSGLGLSFVKEVAFLHDATILVESPVVKQAGTKVSLVFQF